MVMCKQLSHIFERGGEKESKFPLLFILKTIYINNREIYTDKYWFNK